MDDGARFARWFIRLSLGAAAVGLATMAATPRPSQPITGHASPALADILAAEHPTVRAHYELYAVLRELPGARTLVVPPVPLLDPLVLAGISGLEVREEDYDPTRSTLPPGPVVTGEVRAVIDGSPGRHPFVVVLPDESAPTLRLVVVGGTLGVIPDGPSGTR